MIEYLSTPIVGEDGQISELGELIADKASKGRFFR
jgi:hypothetical protein